MTKSLIAASLLLFVCAASSNANNIEVFQLDDGQVIVLGDDNISEIVTVSAGFSSGSFRIHVFSSKTGIASSNNVIHHVNEEFENVSGIYVDFGGGRTNYIQQCSINPGPSIGPPLIFDGFVEVRCASNAPDCQLSILNSLITDDIVFDSAAGDDRFYVANSTILGDVDIDTGIGNDDARLLNTDIDGELIAWTASGADDVRLNDCNIGNRLDVRTGNGSDTVDIRDSSSRSLFVNLGNGFDDFKLLESTVQTTTVVRGGAHTDEGIQADNSFGKIVLFLSFESGNVAN